MRTARHRPNRRKKRREKALQLEQLSHTVSKACMHEQELENGELPLSMLVGLRDALDTIAEDDVPGVFGDTWLLFF